MRQTLGHYKILRPIGSGGMGEVYAAEDPKLNRQVAIKVLPEDMALQPERVQRFEREAQAVAALDHPNIVTIYSVEEDDGVHFIVMQLVEGETLAEMIPRQGFPLEKFFKLAIPIADAISAAHEHGITHRDLKPANIMVTGDGRVKILDFGLAKLREGEAVAADGPTVASGEPLTGEGKILGTVAYMSPEQAEGKEVDHRSDIFSLGIVLYEMATGERPFSGDTSVSLVSSIVKDTPKLVTELNAALPRHLGRIVRYCLGKDPGHRYQSAVDVRNELAELRREIDSGEMAVPLRQGSGRRWLVPAALGVPLLALVLWLTWPQLVGAGESGLGTPEVRPLTDLSGIQAGASLSPDGRSLLYIDNTRGDWDIHWQRIGGEPINLTEDYLEDDFKPAFDPNGERVAFSSEREGGGLFVMGATGERPRRVSSRGFHPSWSPDGGKLVYSDVGVADAYNWTGFGRLWVVDIETREESLLFDQMGAVEPSWSPNGKRIAFWSLQEDRRDIWTIPASGGDPVAVTRDDPSDFSPFWSPDGGFLYFPSDRGGKPDLWRVPMNEDSGETLGPPERVWAPPIGQVIQGSISADGGSIACTVALVTNQILRVPFDPETGQLAGAEEELYSTRTVDLTSLNLSPDDGWLAFTSEHGVEDLFVMPADGSRPPDNLTNDRYANRAPNWYPVSDRDGGWLTFHSNRAGPSQIFAIRPDGTGLRQLTEGLSTIAPKWWPDGRLLAVTVRGNRLIYQFPDGLTGGAVGSAGRGNLLVGPTDSWSPNGQLIAQERDGQLRVVSVDSRFNQTAVDQDGNPYDPESNRGNRWLDERRLIFWDENRRKAFLWDLESETATDIAGIQGEDNHFAFSKDGRTLFIRRETDDLDIWLVELPQ